VSDFGNLINAISLARESATKSLCRMNSVDIAEGWISREMSIIPVYIRTDSALITTKNNIMERKLLEELRVDAVSSCQNPFLADYRPGTEPEP
jgi:hypothetical protein